ncbi:tail fiber domain-containing protein [Desulfobulbus sp. AH-315-M07]|nr:tail fiber domain-containing protein [Desulfobulbus sp. AH-315-M07]
MRITTSGNVGIGTTDPQALLHVAGTAICDGGCTSSSRELKDNIRDLSTKEALATMRKLRPTRFTYKHNGEEEVGFIAEDVPDLVAKPGRKGLDAMDIVAVLTKVVQQQQSELTRLRSLEARLSRLERTCSPMTTVNKHAERGGR